MQQLNFCFRSNLFCVLLDSLFRDLACLLRGGATAFILISASQTFASSTQTLNSFPRQDIQAQGEHLLASKQEHTKERDQILTQAFPSRPVPGHCSLSQATHGFLEASTPRSMKKAICSQYQRAATAQHWCSGEALSRCSGLLFGGLGSGIAHCSCSVLYIFNTLKICASVPAQLPSTLVPQQEMY